MSTIGESVEVVQRSARLERLRARAPRLLLIATLALTSVLGVRELVSSDETPTNAGDQLTPDYALEDFAQGFARAYLTYEAERPQVRERALAPYTSEAIDAGAGLVPAARRSQAVAWTRVAQNQEALAGGRIVVVATGIAGETVPLYLAVPVDRIEGGAITLSGYPSRVGAPATAQIGPAHRDEVSDEEVLTVAERVVRNYLAGERQNLAADLAPGASVSIPAQQLEVDSVEEIVWAAGIDSSAVLATVIAADESGTSWTLTYELGVERLRGRVLVSFIETLANKT